MKRYDIGEYDSGMIPHNDGDWVRYEDAQELYGELSRLIFFNRELMEENARLKELNREMVEALQEISFAYKRHEFGYGRIMGKTTVEKMEAILAKAGGKRSDDNGRNDLPSSKFN